MPTKCDTCKYQHSIQDEHNTKVCAGCCAFSAWEPMPLTFGSGISFTFDAGKSPDSNVEAIRQKLLTRSEVGLKKYGVTTERTDLDLVQWLTHLQEELLDAAVYIQASIQQDKGSMSKALEELMLKCRVEDHRITYSDLVDLRWRK